MASFIIISSDNRLHHLVDGIIACRPLNPDVSPNISTGKITKSNDGYTYEYTIYGKSSTSKKEKSFADLLSNQLAQFRTAYSTSSETINIFFLENPFVEGCYEKVESWLEGFEEVYKKGHDTNFCVYRILFTYDHDNPTDVWAQVDHSILSDLLKEHTEISNGDSLSFDRFLFYIDNQKSDASALCMNKEEHDLKMPRFLIDFMMLASNSTDAYGVRSGITSPTSHTRCFSVGFAESMYYYPDVERFYTHADLRDTYERILTTNDEKDGELGKEMMEIEKYPLGLCSRQKRLEKIYKDISYLENIKDYPESVDKHIDDSIKELEDMLKAEREKELEEAPEKEPDCPEYINRSMIYEKLDIIISDKKEDIVNNLAEQYEKLVAFSKTQTFMDFVNEREEFLQMADSAPLNEQVRTEYEPSHAGCLGRLLFWKKSNSIDDAPQALTASSDKIKLTDHIKNISKWLGEKKQYIKFCDEIAQIEKKFDEERSYCEDFILTEHINHYFPLIHLERLRQAQRKSFTNRMEEYICKWKEEAQPTLTSLVKLVEEGAKKYARENFAFIDWSSPMPFAKDISSPDIMADICNQLQKKSCPFVNYNQISEFHEDKVTRVLYSDRPDFCTVEFPAMRHLLDKSSAISAIHSKHITSKICMMQFLPMDTGIIESLVDLKLTSKEEKA